MHMHFLTLVTEHINAVEMKRVVEQETRLMLCESDCVEFCCTTG